MTWSSEDDVLPLTRVLLNMEVMGGTPAEGYDGELNNFTSEF